MATPRKSPPSEKSPNGKKPKANEPAIFLPDSITHILTDPKRLRGRPTDFTPEACSRVVALMADGYSLTAAAGALGVSYRTLCNWQKKHPDFFHSVERGKAARTFRLEADMLNTDSGPVVNARRFALVNAAPEEWRDKQTLEHDTPEDSPLDILAKSLAGCVLKPKEE